ncbi:MAG TPA: DNA-processing protein DprA [Candidatus Hydrogenedentes bacterium]|nr:DNA-processing protein DprA [Candidatus Hydrogenedentota bacterium]HOS01453.1 DNA-processing protein DprA [Candidatus Hydrogenedentota bacterium]
MDSDLVVALALLMTPGAGTMTVRRVMKAADALGTRLSALTETPPRRLIDQMPPGFTPITRALAACSPDRIENARRLLRRLADAGAQALRYTDAGYPAALNRHLGDQAPPIVCALGDVNLLEARMAAVAGARNVSPQGARLATLCARALCEHGIPVVSGGAPGVDQAAHGACLEHGGRTIAVLPQGLLTHRASGEWREAISDGRAVLISEFAPDAAWLTHAAVTRNATISALADMACIIEPRKTGGSIRTARCTLAQGKPVALYAPDGPDSPAATLTTAGAVPLLDSDNRFHAQRLLSLWEQGPQKRAAQTDLF